MSDHAKIVREGLEFCSQPDAYDRSLAALDALVLERDVALTTIEAESDERGEWAKLLDAMEAERDEAVEMSRQMVAAYELAGEETEAAEAENARLREAADAAMHELGVPQDHLTPAPVGNAYEILRAALSPKEDE